VCVCVCVCVFTNHRSFCIGKVHLSKLPGALNRVCVVRDKDNTQTAVDFEEKVGLYMRQAAFHASSGTVIPWASDVAPSISASIALSNSVPDVVLNDDWHSKSEASHTRDSPLALFIQFFCWFVQRDPTCTGWLLVVTLYDLKDYLKSKNLEVPLGVSVADLPSDAAFVNKVTDLICTFAGGLQACCGSSQPLVCAVRTASRRGLCICVLVESCCVCVCVCC
jgi:hypothetical protein